MAVSYDGNGGVWDEIDTIIQGDSKRVNLHSCGYTSLLEMGENRALIAYSDFDFVSSSDTMHKAICVREITVDI